MEVRSEAQGRCIRQGSLGPRASGILMLIVLTYCPLIRLPVIHSWLFMYSVCIQMSSEFKPFKVRAVADCEIDICP